MFFLNCIGSDSSLADNKGRAVSVYVYEDKGKLVFDNKYRVADLPGLWVAGTEMYLCITDM